MSREFVGVYGYFWQNMLHAADEHKQRFPNNPIIGALADILIATERPLCAVAGLAACDNGEDYVIEESILAVEKLEIAVQKLKAAVKPYKDVQRNAINNYIKEKKQNE